MATAATMAILVWPERSLRVVEKAVLVLLRARACLLSRNLIGSSAAVFITVKLPINLVTKVDTIQKELTA